MDTIADQTISITTWEMLCDYFSRPVGPWHLRYTTNYRVTYDLYLERVANCPTDEDTPYQWIGTLIYRGVEHRSILRLDEQQHLLLVYEGSSMQFISKIIEDIAPRHP